jgi:L-lactate dehydrogenase complex protein LldG
MSTSRDRILNRLRASRPELGMIESRSMYSPVALWTEPAARELVDHFVDQARGLSSVVHIPTSDSEALQLILDIMYSEVRVMTWGFNHIPLPGLEEALGANGIQAISSRDATVRVGITGADAALASTGSLVLLTGEGKPRLASLLPEIHIAVIHQHQILTNLETWVASLRKEGLDGFQDLASAMIISGPSRTADIAMQLILGIHGPAELHILILR